MLMAGKLGCVDAHFPCPVNITFMCQPSPRSSEKLAHTDARVPGRSAFGIPYDVRKGVSEHPRRGKHTAIRKTSRFPQEHGSHA